MTRRRLITLAGDAEREATIAGRLAAEDRVELFMRCVDRVEVLASVRGGGIEGIVAVGAPSWLDVETIEEIFSASVGIVAVARDPIDVEIFNGLGIAVLPTDPSSDQILAALSTGGANGPASSTPRSGAGRIIAVWGPKGSPGRSRISIELAFGSALKEPRTLLVDADPYGGDLLQLLGVVEELPTIVWAARSAAKKELDAASLASGLRRAGRDGPVVLPGLSRPELAADVSVRGLAGAFELFRAIFAATIVDTGFSLEDDATAHGEGRGGRNRLTRSALSSADRVVAVCRADPVGIKNFLWAFDTLRDLVATEDMVVVANRVLPGQEGEIENLLRDRLGIRPVAFLPDRHEEVTRSVLTSKSLTEMRPGSDIPAAAGRILMALGSQVPRKGVLTRLGGRA